MSSSGEFVRPRTDETDDTPSDLDSAFDSSESQAYNFTDGQFAVAYDTAETATAEAETFLDELLAISTDLVHPSTEVDLEEVDTSVQSLDLPSAPADINAEIEAVEEPVCPVGYALDFDGIDGIEVPRNDAEKPNIVLPDEPSPFSETAPSAPSIGTVDKPSKPSLTTITAPTIEDLSLPVFLDIDIPTFSEAPPEFEDITPPDALTFTLSTFSDEFMTELRDKLVEDLTTGGTGINETVEDAIWEREQSRQDADFEDKMYEVETMFASRGFSMPPGALGGLMARITLERTRADANINNEIVVRQTDLAQKQTQFALQQMTEIEKMVRDFYVAQNTLLWQAQEAIVKTAIAIYQARFEQAKINAEIYRVKVDAYKSSVDAEIARSQLNRDKVALYQAQIDGEKAKVELYTARIGANESLARLYQIELEGSKIDLEIERLWLERYQILVNAYTAKINAKSAEYDIYGKKVDAQVAKAQIYGEQVKGFLAEVEGTKAQIEAQIAKFQAKTDYNKAIVEYYRTQVDAYGTKINAKVAEAGLEVSVYDSQIRGYSAQVEAEINKYKARLSQIEQNVEKAKLDANVAIEEMKTAVQSYLGLKNVQMEAAKAGASIYSQRVAAALSAVNVSAGYNFSSSRSQSASRSASQSESVNASESISESHNYDETGV